MAKYMYKPMGNGKYASILYIESIYQENKKRGWLLEIPEQFKTEPVKTAPIIEKKLEEKTEDKTVIETKPYVRGQDFGQKGARKKN